MGDLEERKVGFRSLQEAMDTSISGGKLIFHVFAALAELEHGIIQERTKAGLAVDFYHSVLPREKMKCRFPILIPSRG